MGSLKFQFSQLGFNRLLEIRMPELCPFMVVFDSPLKISCGLRNGPRKPLWRKRVLSTEAIQAVQSLKLAKSSAKLEEIFRSRICRLLKADLLDTLTELQRQNELELAFKPKQRRFKPV
ncbi:chitinase [Sarracenia purpurea var. burkii]